MPPQELKFYILHGLYVLNTFSVVSRSETSYLVISKNPRISKIERKNVIKGGKDWKSGGRAPEEVIFHILQHLYVINMVSVLRRSEMAYLIISKNHG